LKLSTFDITENKHVSAPDFGMDMLLEETA